MTDVPDFRVLLRSESTGGHVALVENTVPPHWEGTPLHHHGAVPARYLLVCTPSGSERYVDLRQAEITGTDPPAEGHRGFPTRTSPALRSRVRAGRRDRRRRDRRAAGRRAAAGPAAGRGERR